MILCELIHKVTIGDKLCNTSSDVAVTWLLMNTCTQSWFLLPRFLLMMNSMFLWGYKYSRP